MENILLEIDGPLGVITLNRPNKINALSLAMMREVTQALESFKDDSSVKVVILRANGKHFCAGHDLAELLEADAFGHREIFTACNRMMELIHEIPQPVIARIQGVATAAGCQLAAACDLALAEEGSKFATPGVRIGLFCTTPMVPLTRAIGRKRAMEMLLTGRMVPAEEALAWGLINRVVPTADLDDEIRRLALSIAEFSPLTIGLGKKAFYTQIDQPESKAYDFALNVMTSNLALEDAREGIRAFLEKRIPAWKGR